MDFESIFGKSDSFCIKEIKSDLDIINVLLSDLISNKPELCDSNENKFEIAKYPISKKEIFSRLKPYFGKCINWKSPHTQFNITPPIPIASISGTAIANSLNQTLVSDMASGKFSKLELDLAKYISKLVNWDSKKSSGIFTFGGTGTNLYGAKIGINKADKYAYKNGIKNLVIFDSDQAHSSHKTVADWLGVGIDNNIIVPSDEKGHIIKNSFKELLCQNIENNKLIGCINLSGGTTYDWSIDKIDDLNILVNKVVEKYSLEYSPHIHVDSVIGWVLLFFDKYSLRDVEEKLNKDVFNRISEGSKRISKLYYADSFGVDFHKTGFSAYSSSLFMLRNREEFDLISKGAEGASHQSFELGDYSPGKFTLETSRGVNGPVSAFLSLNAISEEGFRKLIIHFFNLSSHIRCLLDESKNFSVLNKDAVGWATMFSLNSNKGMRCFTNDLSEFELNKYNAVQKSFFNFLNMHNKQKDFWKISLSSNYKVTKNGFPISALKIYPMSPLTSIKDNEEFFLWINNMANKFRL